MGVLTKESYFVFEKINSYWERVKYCEWLGGTHNCRSTKNCYTFLKTEIFRKFADCSDMIKLQKNKRP